MSSISGGKSTVAHFTSCLLSKCNSIVLTLDLTDKQVTNQLHFDDPSSIQIPQEENQEENHALVVLNYAFSTVRRTSCCKTTCKLHANYLQTTCELTQTTCKIMLMKIDYILLSIQNAIAIDCQQQKNSLDVKTKNNTLTVALM